MDASTSRSSNPIRILLLSDQPELRRMMAAGLRLHGFELIGAVADQPQLAILHTVADIGPEALAAQLAPWRERGLPVLVMSNGGEAGRRQIYLDAGASDYLGMPFEWDTLLERIQACLDATHSRQF